MAAMQNSNDSQGQFLDFAYFKSLAPDLEPEIHQVVLFLEGILFCFGIFASCIGLVRHQLGIKSLDRLLQGPSKSLLRTMGSWLLQRCSALLFLERGYGDLQARRSWREGIHDDFSLGNGRRLMPRVSPGSLPRRLTAPTDRQDGETRVIIIGAGGHAKEVIDTVRACGRHVIAMDDDPEKWGKDVLGARISAIDEKSSHGALIAIGDNARRKERCRSLGFHWETAIHPTAWVAPTARLGRGTVVFAGAVIQSDVVIGDHVIVNCGATISHDCVIGDFAHIAPGAHLAGNVRVGEGAFIGIGSTVIQQVAIGAWTTVGAGAVVLDDLAESMVVVGVPAKPIHRRTNVWGVRHT
jgi:sugar O-acyltransferase (sialic acid O-acetyltransferase NeuD family)